MRVHGFAVVVAWAALCAPVAAQDFTGWDGANPFDCELQQAGLEATGPDRTADPYCVEFDKTQQNVTGLGVVDFLSKEPERVAAAGDKCFYFQSDHWRGSLVQDDGTTKTYEWDGHYMIDRARGIVAGWVTNANVNGRTFDPSTIPGIPSEFSRHMGPGTMGGIASSGTPFDPRCRAKAAAEPVYATPPAPRCAQPGLPFAPGATEGRARELLGPPGRVHRGALRWCVAGGGALRAVLAEDRSGEYGTDPSARVVLVLTTRPAHRVRLRGARRLFVLGRTRVVRLRDGRVAGVRKGRLRYLAAADRRLSTRALRSVLRRAT